MTTHPDQTNHYQVLARKWRPKAFKEMVGQEHVLRMLINALDNQRLHHAYLFTGTRGVGKTSVARLFAKCLNCEAGISSTPCNQCQICRSIDAGRFLDLIEVDAASRTKVEDTRELLENVQYAPAQGRFKIYLIDEVHMLSGHSFNALLKTLEEPPAHVKFLLATTDPKQLPITILSRCLQFYLKQVPTEQISAHLEKICAAEHFSYEPEALKLIAKAADGSLRDSLSLLDQAVAYTNATLSLAMVREMLGYVEQNEVESLLATLAKKDGNQLFQTIHKLSEQAPDFNHILEELLSMLHQIAIVQVIPDANTEPNIQSLAKLFTPEVVQLYYQIALIGRRDLPLTPNPAQGFEMLMLRMLAFEPVTSANNVIKKSEAIAKPALRSSEKMANAAPLSSGINTNAAPLSSGTMTNAAPQSSEKIVNASPPSPEKITNAAPLSSGTMTNAAPQSPEKITTAAPLSSRTMTNAALSHENEWTQLLPKLGLTGVAHALASNCFLIDMKEDKIQLGLSPSHEAMLNKKQEERIADALLRTLNRPIKLDIKITGQDKLTPAKAKKNEENQQQATAEAIIQNDATVKQIMDIFGASIEPHSIKPIKRKETPTATD